MHAVMHVQDVVGYFSQSRFSKKHQIYSNGPNKVKNSSEHKKIILVRTIFVNENHESGNYRNCHRIT